MALNIGRVKKIDKLPHESLRPLDYGSYTITGTAGTLLSFADTGSPGSKDALPAGAKSFRGTLETGAVRARLDGTAVTATEGELIEVGTQMILDVAEMSLPQSFIRTGGASGVLRGHFFDIEPTVLVGG